MNAKTIRTLASLSLTRTLMSSFPSRLSPILVIVCCLAAFFIVSCNSTSTDSTDSAVEALALPSVTTQKTQNRVWSKVELRKLFQLPDQPDTMLYYPGAVIADRQNNIYIVDFGIYKVFRFDPDGQYITSYGEGMGSGPGELSSILDVSITRDTVTIVDNTARKILNFHINGRFLSSRTTSFAPVRHTITAGGREYTLTSYTEHIFESRMGEEVTKFGMAPKDGIWDHMGIGSLTTYQERLMYAPVDFPVIVQYKPDGSIAYARGTPDWGKVDPPELEIRILGSTRAARVIGPDLHEDLSVYDGRLFVTANLNPGAALDIYDISTGDYENSIRLPNDEDNYTYAMNDRIYQMDRSTSVLTVYGIIEQQQ